MCSSERQTALQELLQNEDAAGIEYAVVMPSPTRKPDNRALYETAGMETRSRVQQEHWLATRACPVLRLDSARAISCLMDDVIAALPAGGR